MTQTSRDQVATKADVRVSIIQQPHLTYPESSACFSPSEAYPEYRFDSYSSKPNPVYAAVRDLLRQAGLDAQHFGTPDWNPLGEFIASGSSVFVLCNFVYHSRVVEDRDTFQAKVTHASVLRAVIDYLLIAVGTTSRIRFGNAPVQSADWSLLMQETGAACIVDYYKQRGIVVEACDLRSFVAKRDWLGGVTSVEYREKEEIGVSFDLADRSLLSPLQGREAQFRVSEYDPKRTMAHHRDGQHVYVLNRKALEADVIFSIPKLKTHQKCGVTCGLKGTVGTIAEKDCLAHHRFGSPEQGGDEYPRDRTGLLRLHSRLHDYVWSTPPESSAGRLLRIADRSLQRLQRLLGVTNYGSWHGNDTTWRMALDIARILRYGGLDGKLHDEPQRSHLMLVDGVIGGEGNGPLAMTPVKSGTLIFSSDVPVGDYVAATVMGFDPMRIPLIREAFKQEHLKLTECELNALDMQVVHNGDTLSLDGLESLFTKTFEPAPGWRGSIER